jgi:hypothetical protein
MSNEGFKTTTSGKINATYTNKNIVDKLTAMEPLCSPDDQLPTLKTIKTFFEKKDALDHYTNTDILFKTEKLVIDCQKKILEWDKSTHDSLSAKFDELERKRNELWLLKNKPEIARQPNDQRPIEYQTFGSGDGVGSGFPDIAYSGFKNPYDRDPDIATKIDENKYTVEELNTILEEVRDVVFSKSGEEQAKAKLSYIEKYNTVDQKLTTISDIDKKFGNYKAYLNEKHGEHVKYLIKEKQLIQLKTEIEDLSQVSAY